MSGSEACRDDIVAAGCGSLLLAALEMPNEDRLLACCKALSRLAAGSKSRCSAIEWTGCLPLLAARLAAAMGKPNEHASDRIKQLRTAVQSLQLLAGCTDAYRTAIVQSGCVAQLAAELYGWRSLRRDVVYILHKLASKNEEHERAVEAACRGALQRMSASQKAEPLKVQANNGSQWCDAWRQQGTDQL